MTPEEALEAKRKARASLAERESNYTFMTLLGEDSAWRFPPKSEG